MADHIEITNIEERRTSFNSVAEIYDHIRPSYPPALFEQIDTLLSPTAKNRAALEIGIGTGQATPHFLARGFHITALDIAPDMLAIARNRIKDQNCSFVLSSFEDFKSPPDRFDLIYAAQSFHWVDPSTGYEKAANLLRKDGSLALIWNVKRKFADPDEEILQRIYETHAPALCSKPEGRAPFVRVALQNAQRNLANRRNLFPYITKLSVEWTKTYTTQDYICLLESYSDHIVLENPAKSALFKAIADWLDAKGGEISVVYDSVTLLARKSSTNPTL
jgi:ubiquinone/menaquinone biosynthesis C-methylase UbiE